MSKDKDAQNTDISILTGTEVLTNATAIAAPSYADKNGGSRLARRRNAGKCGKSGARLPRSPSPSLFLSPSNLLPFPPKSLVYVQWRRSSLPAADVTLRTSHPGDRKRGPYMGSESAGAVGSRPAVSNQVLVCQTIPRRWHR